MDCSHAPNKVSLWLSVRPENHPLNDSLSLEGSISPNIMFQFSSVQFSRSIMSDSLRTHGLQHASPPCPSPTPGVHSNSCPFSRWCHPTICHPLLLPPLIFPSIGVFSNITLVCMLSHFRCVRLFSTLWTVAARLLCPWDYPGKNTGVGCHALLQGIFQI